MNNKKLIILIALLLSSLLVFGGCQKVEEPQPAPAPAPTEQQGEAKEADEDEKKSETETENDSESKDPASPATGGGVTPVQPVTPPVEEPAFNAQQDFENFRVVNDEQGYTNVDARRFKFFVDTFSQEFAVLIDASPVSDFQNMHIPKSINIPAPEIWNYLDTLDKEKNILVYARNDKQSLYVTRVLADNGFPYIFRLQGNLSAWTDRGFATERIITQGDLDNVRSIIEGLPEGQEKEEMKERLRLLQATLDLQEPVKRVEALANALDQEGRATQDEIDRARSAYEATRQLAIDKQIDVRDSEIIQRLAIAEAKITSAEKQKFILEAREAIDAIQTESDAEFARLLVEKVADQDLRTIMFNEIRAKVRVAEEDDAVDSALKIAESLRRDGSDTQESINRAKAAYDIATKFLAESDEPENLKSIKEAKLIRTLNLINQAQDALDIKNAKELLKDLGIN